MAKNDPIKELRELIYSLARRQEDLEKQFVIIQEQLEQKDQRIKETLARVLDLLEKVVQR